MRGLVARRVGHNFDLSPLQLLLLLPGFLWFFNICIGQHAKQLGLFLWDCWVALIPEPSIWCPWWAHSLMPLLFTFRLSVYTHWQLDPLASSTERLLFSYRCLWGQPPSGIFARYLYVWTQPWPLFILLATKFLRRFTWRKTDWLFQF